VYGESSDCPVLPHIEIPKANAKGYHIETKKADWLESGVRRHRQDSEVQSQVAVDIAYIDI